MNELPSWLQNAKDDVEAFTGRRPQNRIVHLSPNGERLIPVLETPEGIDHYVGRNLLGRYNIETQNATFPGSSWAKHAIENLELGGLEGLDVTELLMKKRGIDPKLLDVINPETLANLDEESVTAEELEELRNQIKESQKKTK